MYSHKHANFSTTLLHAGWPRNCGLILGRGKIFYCLQSIQIISGGKTAALWPTAEIKNAWYCTATVAYAFQVWCLIKHRNVTFTSSQYVNSAQGLEIYTNCRFTCSYYIACAYILIEHRWRIYKFVVVMAQLRQLALFKEEHGCSDFLLHDVHSTTLNWFSCLI